MTRLADYPLDLAIRILPTQVRRRYVAEFDADLQSLPRGRRRTGYAVSTLVGAPRLRWEVLHAAAGSGAGSADCGLGILRAPGRPARIPGERGARAPAAAAAGAGT